MNLKINKLELILLGLMTVFALVWVLIVTPYMEQSNTFANLNPVFQYILFNTGFILLSIVFINIPVKLVSKKKINFITMVKVGLAGWLLFSFIFDLWQPPNYLSPTGQILIPAQSALPNTAVDAMLTYLWSFIIPQTLVMGYSLVYIFVYFITPIIAVFAMILLLKPSMVIKILTER